MVLEPGLSSMHTVQLNANRNYSRMEKKKNKKEIINFLTVLAAGAHSSYRCVRGNKESLGYIGFRWLTLNLMFFLGGEKTSLWPLSWSLITLPSFPNMGIYVRDGYSLRFLLRVWTLCTVWYDVAIIPAQIPFWNPRKEKLSLFSPLQKSNCIEKKYLGEENWSWCSLWHPLK